MCIYVYMCVYIYIHICREREFFPLCTLIWTSIWKTLSTKLICSLAPPYQFFPPLRKGWLAKSPKLRILDSELWRWQTTIAMLECAFFAKNHVKLISLCFWPQKFSIRRLKINLIHLIQKTDLYKNPQMCNFVKKAKPTPNILSITRCPLRGN